MQRGHVSKLETEGIRIKCTYTAESGQGPAAAAAAAGLGSVQAAWRQCRGYVEQDWRCARNLNSVKWCNALKLSCEDEDRKAEREGSERSEVVGEKKEARKRMMVGGGRWWWR